MALIASSVVGLATMTVLGPYWAGESGAFFACVVMMSVTVAVASGVVIVLLQRSGRRITRAIGEWGNSAKDVAHFDDSIGATSPRPLIGQSDIGARVLYLVLSSLAIILTIAAAFITARDEGGAFMPPLAIVVVMQVIVWIGIEVGVNRVLKAYRRA